MERAIKNPEKRKQKLILARAMDLPQGKVASRAPSTAKVRVMSRRRATSKGLAVLDKLGLASRGRN